jgi:hypothetical protein
MLGQKVKNFLYRVRWALERRFVAPRDNGNGGLWRKTAGIKRFLRILGRPFSCNYLL